MRNWGVVITTFYVLIVAGFSPAILLLAAGNEFRELWFDLYSEPWTWVLIVLLAGGPLILLLVRVDTRQKRPKRRLHIAAAVAAAALAFSLLAVGAAASLNMATLATYDWPCGHFCNWTIAAALFGSWAMWALGLWWFRQRIFEPDGRIYRWLIIGSVLELLVAVPSHVTVRQRNDCSAPFVSAFGVATGIAILLMSLGPGALFLYRARMRQLKPRENGM